MGFVVGDRAMEEAIRMTNGYSIGIVGVHRGTHYDTTARIERAKAA